MTCRRFIAVGGALCVLGLALAGTAPVAGTADSGRTLAMQTMGGVLVLAGWVCLGWGIHRLGRRG